MSVRVVAEKRNEHPDLSLAGRPGRLESLARRPGRSIRFGERLPDLPNAAAHQAVQDQYDQSIHFEEAFHKAESSVSK